MDVATERRIIYAAVGMKPGASGSRLTRDGTAPSTPLHGQQLINHLHVGRFVGIAIMEYISAFSLLRTFS